ncbi:MAG: hypothetical protein A2Y12_16105 [Planctomycetes bacterium GWF2_42_9]|nr:MAG: hypothetical protein A2Y12_16105 [Planctomycetes bacterium GWF2_42_9]
MTKDEVETQAEKSSGQSSSLLKSITSFGSKIKTNYDFRMSLINKLAEIWISVEEEFDRACGRQQAMKLCNTGKDCRIHGQVIIRNPENLTIGDYVRIGRGCYFFCAGGLIVGNNTQISRYVTIYTGNHDTKGDAIPYNDSYVYKPVTIGHSVWIGMHVCIVPGVKIGDGAIIGMGTVVSKDVPPGAVLVGAPQRIVKTRNMEQFNKHHRNEKYFGKLWPDL